MTKLKKKKLNIAFSGLMMVVDFCVVVVAFALCYWVRFHSGFFPVPLGIPSYKDYVLPVAVIGALLIIVLNANGLYRFSPIKKFIDHIFRLTKNICVTMFFIFAGTFFYREYSYSRVLIIMLWIALIFLLITSRYILKNIYVYFILPRVRKKIIVIGSAIHIEALTRHRKYFQAYGKIVGFILPRKTSQGIETLPCLGHLDDFSRILDEEKPDEVILAGLDIPRRTVIELILQAEKRLVGFKIVADLLEIMIQQFELENVDGLNLIKIKESPLNFASNRFTKRTMDFVGSLSGLIVLSPILAIVAFLVKVTSGGSVFFAQERVSEEGKVFKIYKFRTMVPNAEATTGPVFTQREDARCTAIGGFLRKYNIDELPQLFNVLRGEMSLVGPRPERPHFVEQFKDDIPRYMSRHHVKSGITGWAQVNGLRQSTAISERIKYDLYYLENWSVWLDIKIIILSFFALKNAY